MTNDQLCIFYCTVVTHQHQFVGESRCLLVCDGKVRADGAFSECVASSGGLLDFVSQNAGGGGADPDKKEDVDVEKDEKDSSDDPERKEVAVLVNQSKETNDDTNAVSDQDEKKESGLVSRATFAHYARSMGGFWVAIWLFILFVLSQIASLAAIAMIGRWSERTLEGQVSVLWVHICVCESMLSRILLHLTVPVSSIISEIVGHFHHCQFSWCGSGPALFCAICGIPKASSAGFQKVA